MASAGYQPGMGGRDSAGTGAGGPGPGAGGRAGGEGGGGGRPSGAPWAGGACDAELCRPGAARSCCTGLLCAGPSLVPRSLNSLSLPRACLAAWWLVPDATRRAGTRICLGAEGGRRPTHPRFPVTAHQATPGPPPTLPKKARKKVAGHALPCRQRHRGMLKEARERISAKRSPLQSAVPGAPDCPPTVHPMLQAGGSFSVICVVSGISVPRTENRSPHLLLLLTSATLSHFATRGNTS